MLTSFILGISVGFLTGTLVTAAVLKRKGKGGGN